MTLQSRFYRSYCRLVIAFFIVLMSKTCLAQTPNIETVTPTGVKSENSSMQNLVPRNGPIRLDLVNAMQYSFQEDEFSLAEILQLNEDTWGFMSESGASLGFKSDRSLWLKTTVTVESEKKLLLLMDYAILDYVTVFIRAASSDAFVEHQTGDMLALHLREISHRKLVVPVTFSPGDNQLFIKVKTYSSYTVPVILMDEQTFYESESLKNMFLSALFGGAFYMVLLNLFGGLRLRNRGYIYYVVFASAFLLFNFTLHGYARFYLWPSLPQLNDMMVVVFGLAGGLGYALFLTKFLPLKKYYPVDYRICHSQAILCGLLAVLCMLGLRVQLQMFAHMLNAVFALYSMVLAFRVWRGGSKNAMYLFIGWMCLMSSVVVKAMVAMGLLPFSDVLFHLFDLGMTLNFAFISLGLASKIVDIQEKEIEARKEADSARSLAILNMEHYRALFEYAPIPMFKVDQSDHFIAANRAFIQLFGYGSEKQLLQSKIKSKSTYCVEKHYLRLVSDLKKFHEADIETRIRTKSGTEHWVRVTVRAIEEKGYTIFEGACIDVTDQVERQEFEKAAHKREVNQLEALVAGVAHYLNTPLGTVNTAQSVVTGKTLEVEQDLSAQKLTATRLKNFLDVIQESGNVITNSVQKSINVVERFKELNPEEETVSQSLVTSTELLKSLKLSLNKDVRQHINIVFDDTSAKARRLPLNQMLVVLKKLIHNAYTHGNASEVYIALTEQDEGINLVFKDNGQGLSDKVNADDLFAPFFAKTLSLNEVSGLDLFVVKTIIQNRLNGQVNIHYDSLPALVFHIWIPVSE